MVPHFLQLLKNNILIGSIIATGEIDFHSLSGLDYNSYNEQSIELHDFKLSEEESFSSLMIKIIEGHIHLTFKVDRDDRFFANSEDYFGINSFIRESNPQNNIPGITRTKKFYFYQNNPAIEVIVKNSTYFKNLVEVRVLKGDEGLKDIYNLSWDSLLTMYEELCIQYDQFKNQQQERPSQLIRYKLLEIFELFKNRNELSKITVLLNHNNLSVKRIAASHLLLHDEKTSLAILDSISKVPGYQGLMSEEIIDSWKRGKSEILF